MKRAAFLDRDGVINIDHAYVHDREHFEWVPGVLEGARMLTDAGFLLVVVTNQSGIGRGYYTEADFHALTDWMCSVFAQAGAPIAAVRFCPHHPEKALGLYRRECRCRKPQPGMILDAAKDLNIDLSRSILSAISRGTARRVDPPGFLNGFCSALTAYASLKLVPTALEQQRTCFPLCAPTG